MFDLVKGIVEMIAEKLHEASRLEKGMPNVYTPFAKKRTKRSARGLDSGFLQQAGCGRVLYSIGTWWC